MGYEFIVGIDLSKSTFDYTLLQKGEILLQENIANSKTEVKTWFNHLWKSFELKKKNTLYCLEHSGVYKEFLLSELTKRKALVWMESALRIKRSLGIQRGKNDRLDSERIAYYALKNQQSALLYKEPRLEVQRLKHLSGLKNRLQTAILALQWQPKENKSFLKRNKAIEVKRLCGDSITALKLDLKRTLQTMQEIIKGDEALNHLYTLITSVDGVGPVLATEMIIATNEFKRFPSANKFACYCGVAPFEHTSGSSVKGKTRVSKIANKHIKAILHIAALSSIKMKGELREYYLRKVREGHTKMAVINAVRNKLIHRIFSCVQNDRPYQKVLLNPLGKVRV